MRSKFMLHDLVVVTKPITIEPCNTIIEKGEKGKIIDIDPETNDLTVRLNAQFPDLHCQRNCIFINANEARHYLGQINPRHSYLPNAQTFFYGMMAIALFVAPGDRLIELFIQKANADRPAPVTFQRYALATNQVRAFDPNGRLMLHAERLEVRPCIYKWINIFKRSKDGHLIAEDRDEAHHVSPLDKVDIYDFWIKVPNILDPGDYILQISATMDCDGGQIVDFFGQPMHFTVTENNTPLVEK